MYARAIGRFSLRVLVKIFCSIQFLQAGEGVGAINK